MDPNKWDINSYIIPASHIRGYPRGVQDESTARLRISVNKYTPKRSSPPSKVAATIIFTTGVGSTKESYEPFFARLLDAGLDIRSVWAADIAWQGKSYLLNESIIGDEPHWDDAVRDILQMVNYFQEEMPPPIVGMGQSWGGYPIMQTALFHPRLFTAVVALEPFLAVGGAEMTMQGNTTLLMAKRRDRWSSREEARQALLKTPYYAAFDPDVFDRVMKYDLRDIPTESLPAQSRRLEHVPVMLTTPKAMEVATMIRLNPANDDDPTSEFDPNVDQSMIPGFHRVEPALIQRRLGLIRPQTLYVFATNSTVDRNGSYLEFLMQNTGIGRGGNGGRAKGAVASAIVKGSSHPMPLEKPKQTADVIVPWLKQVVAQWEKGTNEIGQKFWVTTINPTWLDKMSKL